MEVKKEFAESELVTGKFTPELLTGVNRILLSPGVSVSHPFIQLSKLRGIQVIGDIELFAQQVKKPVIAITGSNGKSTVTTLLGNMLQSAGLKVAVGGNLGTPALDLLQSNDTDVYVLELSSFQLETTDSLKPAVSVVLNISEDHMDRYPDFAAYTKSKERIYSQSSCCVLNQDDPNVLAMEVNKNAKKLAFTKNVPSENQFGLLAENGNSWLCYGNKKIIKAKALKLIGKHNLSNALAALALAKGFGIDVEKTLPALQSFSGLAHRCQWVADHNGICWVNDSKATNVGATLAAIESMPDKVVLIAGGDGKDADFEPLKSIAKGQLRAAVLFGKDAELLRSVLKDLTHCFLVSDMQSAVAKSSELAKRGDTVLLAPACASFDMFNSYIERGDEFTRCVLELLDK